MKRIGIVGTGQMGIGIAQVLAHYGYSVLLYNRKEERLNIGLEKLNKSLKRQVAKAELTEQESQMILQNIIGVCSLENLADQDLVIESIVEDMSAKLVLFSELDSICSEHTIIASNTSSLSISELAAVTNRPEKVIGMHFMNPAQKIKLVEVISGKATSSETRESITNVCLKIGKEPVQVTDRPGFVSNRILIPMINEAIHVLYEGGASAEDIDKVMKLGMNHPIGPLALADLIGLDVVRSILKVLESNLGEKYSPCPLLEDYVNMGRLGRKTGLGFYEYSK